MRRKPKPINCQNCGAEFMASSPHAKYCPDCRPVMYQLQNKRRYMRNTLPGRPEIDIKAAVRCPLRRCEWAKDGRCLFMLGGWRPNQARRRAEEERIRQERMRRAAEEAETLEMLRRFAGGQEDA